MDKEKKKGRRKTSGEHRRRKTGSRAAARRLGLATLSVTLADARVGDFLSYAGGFRSQMARLRTPEMWARTGESGWVYAKGRVTRTWTEKMDDVDVRCALVSGPGDEETLVFDPEAPGTFETAAEIQQQWARPHIVHVQDPVAM